MRGKERERESKRRESAKSGSKKSLTEKRASVPNHKGHPERLPLGCDRCGCTREPSCLKRWEKMTTSSHPRGSCQRESSPEEHEAREEERARVGVSGKREAAHSGVRDTDSRLSCDKLENACPSTLEIGFPFKSRNVSFELPRNACRAK